MKLKFLFAAFLLVSPAHAADNTFSFVVLGDVPNELNQMDRYLDLRDRVKTLNPDFVVQTADVKDGSACSEDELSTFRDIFASFKRPLVYVHRAQSTDCSKQPSSKGFFARLRSVRGRVVDGRDGIIDAFRAEFGSYSDNDSTSLANLFKGNTFPTLPDDATLLSGDKAMPLSDRVWAYRQIMFAEKQTPVDGNTPAWLNTVFNQAQEKRALGVVLMMPSPWDEAAEREPFANRDYTNPIISVLRTRAQNFDGQIILIAGSSRGFRIDKPVYVDKFIVPNFTRVRPFDRGTPGAVRIAVDPSKPGLFGFQPIMRIP